MRCLYLYSDKTGLGRSKKKNNKIISKLQKIFTNLDILKTDTLEEFSSAIDKSIGVYDSLVICGGDGTLKFAVNCLMKYPKDKRPILGYLPGGTVNDGGKAFGCGSTFKSGLKNLARLTTTDIDLMKVNDEYLTFVLAIGAFSDISYCTHRTGKKIIGRLAYYFAAIPRVFKKRIVEAKIEADGKEYNVKTPFIMVLNSRNVGGFPINFKYSIHDGMVELYATKPGIFNGILHILFFKIKTLKIKAKNIKISTNSQEFWCYDGERGGQKDVEISVLNNELKVYGRP